MFFDFLHNNNVYLFLESMLSKLSTQTCGPTTSAQKQRLVRIIYTCGSTTSAQKQRWVRIILLQKTSEHLIQSNPCLDLRKDS